MKPIKFIYTLILVALAGYAAQAQTTPDPGIPGPYAVTKGEYNFGDAVANLDSLATDAEVRASVHYPTGLPGGPFPVIVLLHGRHSTCYRTTAPFNASLAWPCPVGYASIESFQGYDYHARFMASHGYIVISISCNAINAVDGSMSNSGMPARGQLVQYHLDLWNAWNTSGGAPASLGSPTMWVGKVDLSRVGTMGHSRGGEGVVYHALLNRSLGSPYGVKAVLTLAPVDFFRRKLNGIPLMNVAPYCDGDVSNIQGVHFYDDVRYTDPMDESPKYNVVMMGGNHNFYNTVWTPGSYIAGTSDDWGAASTDPHCGASVPGNGRMDTTEQKMAYNTYAAAFFRQHVGGEQQFAPILETKDIVPPATSLANTSNLYVSYHPGRTERLDINRTDATTSDVTNTMGGAVNMAGLLSTGTGICGGGVTIPLCNVATQQAKEPHRGTTTISGLAAMGVRWNDTMDYYENEVPYIYQDMTLVDAVQFRAALRYNQVATGTPLDFTVQLIDSMGNIASAVVTDYSNALYYPPGTSPSLLPKVMFNTIRVPISDFTGIDRTKVRTVRFRFNQMTATAGSVLVSDIAFVNSKCGKVNGSIGYTVMAGGTVQFFDTVTSNSGDIVTKKWKFGDPASGVNDSSVSHNPTHIFTTPGVYTVCFYTNAKRVNGWVCADTTCTTVTVTGSTTNVTELHEAYAVTIIPNPASDNVRIFGVHAGDEVRIINSIGQVVITATAQEDGMNLPLDLANGIYHVVVSNDHARVSQKLVIRR